MHPVHTSTDFGIGGAWLAEYTLAALDAGIVFFDANGRASQWNERAAALLGVSEEQLAGRALADADLALVDGDRRPLNVASDPVRRVLRDGEAQQSCRVGIPDATDGLVWRTLSLLPVFGPDREPRAVLATVVPVHAPAASTVTTAPAAPATDDGNSTEWQLAARSILKSAITASIVVDRRGNVVEWNDRFLEMTARGEVELIDAHLEDLCDVDLEWVWEQLAQRTDDWVQGTTWALRSDGVEVAVVGRFSQVEWPDVGDVVVIQLLDPYEMLHRDTRLRETAELQLFAQAEMPMLLITELGIVADANAEALSLLGQPKLAVIGQPLAEHLIGLDPDRLRECAVEARASATRIPVGTFLARDQAGEDPVVVASLTALAIPAAPSPYLVVQLASPTHRIAGMAGPGDAGRFR